MHAQITIENFVLNFEHTAKENAFVSHDVAVLGEKNGVIWLPTGEEEFPPSALGHLEYLHQKYAHLKSEALTAIAWLGSKTQTWGAKFPGSPPLALVKVTLRKHHSQRFTSSFELQFTDPVDDPYGLWLVEFTGTKVFGVRRQSW